MQIGIEKARELSLTAVALLQAAVEIEGPTPDVCLYRAMIERGHTDHEIDVTIRGLFKLGLVERESSAAIVPTERGREMAASFECQPVMQ